MMMISHLIHFSCAGIGFSGGVLPGRDCETLSWQEEVTVVNSSNNFKLAMSHAGSLTSNRSNAEMHRQLSGVTVSGDVALTGLEVKP